MHGNKEREVSDLFGLALSINSQGQDQNGLYVVLIGAVDAEDNLSGELDEPQENNSITESSRLDAGW